jgi:UDP-N-acetylmuramoyl-tripeptide--D-alanyl-D-alanine ligase
MIALKVKDIAGLVAGTLSADCDPEAVVTGAVRIDSRIIEPGDLFFAISGESFDGHDFTDQARSAGAVTVVVSQPVSGPHLLVTDTIDALGRLAHGVVTQLPDLTTIALTGSSGKTSTKDLLAQVMPALGPTIAPLGSFNNETGLPLTALGVDERTRFLIAEMGARGIGHVAYLCGITPPNIGIVLNVGHAHVGEFGSREAIAQAKGEMVESLSSDGIAILNQDDELVRSMRNRTKARVITFGRSLESDVRIDDVVLAADGSSSFTAISGSEQARVNLPLIGEHHVLNAAAVIAVGIGLGVPLELLADQLAQVRAISRWRMEVTTRADNVTIINDAYNANPESVAAALRALVAISQGDSSEISATRRSFAVLGEMRELGESAQSAHEDIGRLTVELGIGQVIVVGAAASAIAEARSAAGMSDTTTLVANPHEAIELLQSALGRDDVVLVKASRAVGLETVAMAISELRT